MRVLVTGASGAFGEAVVDHMAAAGHEVVALSRRPPPTLPKGVRHAAVDVRDADALFRAMDGIDAVAHLAWATISYKAVADSHAVSVGGTRNVVDAMVRRGVPRLIFTSSATVYGPRPPGVRCREDDVVRPNPDHTYAVHKAEAEALISAAGSQMSLECLIVRAANGLGRTCGGLSEEGYAAPVVPGLRGHAPRLQAVHLEDIGRFYAEAVEKDWTGRVNLAADDDLDFGEFIRILGRPHPRVPFGLLKAIATLSWKTNSTNLDPGAIGSMVSLPVCDTGRLREELGFRCAWTTRDTAEDFARRLKGQFYLGKRQYHLPWSHVRPGVKLPEDRVPELVSEGTWRSAAPDGLAGEFDTPVIPGWETFTAANTSEAFPGPLTPLTLEMAKTALDIAGYDMALMARVGEPLKSMLTHHQPSVFAHGIYANHTVIHALARTMPGYDPAAWDALAFGRTGAPGTTTKHESPSLRAKLRQSTSLTPRLLSLGPEVKALDAEARRMASAGPPLGDLTDEALLARLALLFDLTTHSWAMAASLTGTVMAVYSALEKQAGVDFATRNRVGLDDLASAGAVRAVERLADLARGDERIRTLVTTEPPEKALVKLGETSPSFAAEFDTVVAEYGHRGPREAELSSRMFGDAPERLVDAIAKRLATPARPVEALPALGPRQRLIARTANATQRTRERGRDVALRFEHLYRRCAREIGRRYAERGLIDTADDIFYLVRSEISTPPADVQSVVARRRAERERLAALRLPITFTSQWAPDAGGTSGLAEGESLSGLGVSPGVVTGPVRIMTEESFEEFQPGEVLVTRLTDSGWTPLFAYAGAVVTEIGGVMSHAAVVARELDVPCVVMVDGATTRLQTGQVVEVDGATGTVRASG